MNSNEIQVFQNADFGNVRGVEINGEGWLIGKDVAEALGYSNSRDALAKHVDAEDKDTVAIHDGIGNPNKVVINESGVYALIFGSKLPSAKKFKHWVTHDVLPSIRKHGLYAVDEVLADPDILINALMQLKEERVKNARAKQTIAIQNQQIAELQPKASYYDVILNCQDALPISVIAKDYGWSGVKLNNYLHEAGVQYKMDGTWLLYQEYAQNGYTHTKTHDYIDNYGVEHAKVHTYWMQKGRIFIYNLLKQNGILPIMEQDDSFLDA